MCAVFDRLKQANIDFELHIAGDGPIKPVDGIVNHGYLNKEKAIDLYKSCHVFIMPSLWDCNPLSLIEAAKTGNVIIASKGVGNYPELVNDNGYVFEIGSEDDLYDQYNKLLSKSNEDLLKMGRKSIELSSRISHRNTAQSFYDAIKFVNGKA
jgi:glycosyltransferase involved in cell wall biosynthesis